MPTKSDEKTKKAEITDQKVKITKKKTTDNTKKTHKKEINDDTKKKVVKKEEVVKKEPVVKKELVIKKEDDKKKNKTLKLEENKELDDINNINNYIDKNDIIELEPQTDRVTDDEDNSFIICRIIKYDNEYYLMDAKDTVYTIPAETYELSHFLQENKLESYFLPDESNVYFIAGKRHGTKIVFDEDFLKLKSKLLNTRKNKVDSILTIQKYNINDRILYIPDTTEGYIENIKDNDIVTIVINKKHQDVNIKNIELIE